MSGLAKLQLLISLDNKLKSGFDTAKKQVEKATGQMQGKLDAFKMSNVKAFDAIEERIPGVSGALGMLSNPYTIIAAAAVAAAIAIGAATSKAMEFEHTFMNIRQLNLEKSRNELDSYRSKIVDVALDTGVNLNKMTTGYYDLQSGLAVYGNEALSVSKKIANYSLSTQADYNDSINQSVKAIKAFGLGAKDIDKLLESNVKTVQVGIVTFADLAKVQTEYAGSASAAGQNVDTANKIFAAFTSIAKNADMAANMTKTAFQGLADPRVLKEIENYGVKVYDNTGKMRQFDKIIKETSGQIDKMSDKKFNKFMGDVGGPEGLRALFAKLRTGSEDFFKTLNAFDNSPVDLSKMYDNALNDPTTQIDRVKEQFNTMFTSIGLAFLPLVGKIASGILSITSYFRNLYRDSQLLRDVLSYLGTGLVWAFNMLIIPIKLVVNLIKMLWSDITILGTQIDTFITKVLGIEGGFKGMYNTIRPYLLWIKEFLSEIGGLMFDVFTLNLNGAKNRIENFKLPKLDDIKQRVKVETVNSNDDNPVVTPDGIKPTNTNTNSTVASDAKSIGSGTQTKNVTINIDSFVKGFTPTHQSINGMNTAELERWMTEMFLRVTRSAEMAT